MWSGWLATYHKKRPVQLKLTRGRGTAIYPFAQASAHCHVPWVRDSTHLHRIFHSRPERTSSCVRKVVAYEVRPGVFLSPGRDGGCPFSNEPFPSSEFHTRTPEEAPLWNK